jgi:hypothetical protein
MAGESKSSRSGDSFRCLRRRMAQINYTQLPGRILQSSQPQIRPIPRMIPPIRRIPGNCFGGFGLAPGKAI